MHPTRPKSLAPVATLLATLVLSGSTVLANPYGLGENPETGAATPPSRVEDVVNWLPASYYDGPAPGVQDWVGVQRAVEGKTELPESTRPWSFDTFNGRHNLLAFRELRSSGRGGQQGFAQSPLEKYDTLAASVILSQRGDEGAVSDTDLLRQVPGAARWEADPVNRHNRAPVECSGNGENGGIANGELPVLQEQRLGDEAAVEVEGGEGGPHLIVGGRRDEPIDLSGAPRITEYQGQRYMLYDYVKDVSADVARGAPMPPASMIVENRPTGSGRIVKIHSWFSRLPTRDIRDHADGSWGHVEFGYYGGEWTHRYQTGLDVQYVGARDGGTITLRWGNNQENVRSDVRHRVRVLTREENPDKPGEPAGWEDQVVVDRSYDVDVYTFASGIAVPEGAGANAERYRWEHMILFPSRGVRAELRQIYGERWQDHLPGGSGWLYQYWESTAPRAGASWSGHCAGFAAAAVLFKEPPQRKDVTLPRPVKGVRLQARHAKEACFDKLVYQTYGEPQSRIRFENRDLKGLAVVLGSSVEVGFEHPRRGNVDQEEPGLKIQYPHDADGTRASEGTGAESESWEDILPHNMHIILLDILEQQKRSLVMDRHPCHPVWNSPVYGYTFKVRGKPDQRRYEVEAQIQYAGYGQSFGDGFKAQDTRGTQPKVYPRDGVAPYNGDSIGQIITGEKLEFWLHTDDQNRVIRSEWKGRTIPCETAAASQGQERGTKQVHIHPDFMWIPIGLAPPMYASNGRMTRNPVVDERLLLEHVPVLADESGSYLHDWAR